MGLRRLLKSILGGPVEVVINLEEIMAVLFHRGNKLLLDSVTFLPDGKVVGRLRVRQEICEGHEPIPGQPVMRGVDLVEMSFQLLGIMLAKDEDLADLRGKVFVARETGSLKVRSGFIYVGEELVLETRTDVDLEDMGHGLIKVSSCRMTTKVDGKTRASVDSVTLVGFPDPSSVEPPVETSAKDDEAETS